MLLWFTKEKEDLKKDEQTDPRISTNCVSKLWLTNRWYITQSSNSRHPSHLITFFFGKESSESQKAFLKKEKKSFNITLLFERRVELQSSILMKITPSVWMQLFSFTLTSFHDARLQTDNWSPSVLTYYQTDTDTVFVLLHTCFSYYENYFLHLRSNNNWRYQDINNKR
jgi:hypothetical protein